MSNHGDLPAILFLVFFRLHEARVRVSLPVH